MPTIGQLKFCLADSVVDFVRDDDRDDFVPLVFTRGEDALDFAFRSATIDLFRLVSACASHKVLLQDQLKRDAHILRLQFCTSASRAFGY